MKKTRVALVALALSAAGLTMIKMEEGFSPVAYPDPTYGWEVPTIGYGTTEGVKRGDRITEPEAERRLLGYLAREDRTFQRCTVVPLSQIEYDWYKNFYYNIGAAQYCSSTLSRKLRAGDYRGAADQVLRWKFSNGFDCSKSRKCSGLWTRRLAMHKALLQEIKEIQN